MNSDLNLRISPRTVQQETIEKLRMAIIGGAFAPGSHLVESQLCTKLGVSRPSLREALRSLEAERLIEIIPNRGPFVPKLSWDEATAIYDVRELLEVEAAGRCATLITDSQLLDLERSLNAFEAAQQSDDRLARVTMAAEFFAIIVANCGNAIIEEVHRGLVARISFFRGQSMSLQGRAAKSMVEMRELYQAIAARDEKAARAAAKWHLEKAKAAAREAMEQEG
ncbi:MAG: GntR family transcriptional regulator [Pseudomonadota bacterium]